MKNDEWVTVRDAAEMLGVTVQGIMYKVRVGKVKMRKGTFVGNGREKINVVRVSDLQAWKKERVGDGRAVRVVSAVAPQRQSVLAKGRKQNVDKPRGKGVQGKGLRSRATTRKAVKVVRSVKGRNKSVSS